MILFIICGIILPVFVSFIYDRDIEILVLSAVLGVVLVLVINVFLTELTSKYEVTATYEEKQYNISGLENKTSQEFYLDGRFCLGCGTIHAETDTKMNYYYFKDCEYGKVLEGVSMEETYIREKEDITPSLIWIVEERLYKGHPKLHKWFPLVRKEDEKQGIKTGTILEVPLNTIKIEYNVDV